VRRVIGLTLLLAAALSTAPARVWHATGTWQESQGLPQNGVRCLLQTRDGYIWIGTTGGAARFDGVRFTVFEEGRGGLGDNEVWALAETADGRVWIGTYGGGVSVWKDGRLTLLTTKDGLANDYVAALVADRDGAIWIATDHGLSRYRDGHFTNYAAEGLRAVFVDEDGSLWVGGSAGVLRLVDGDLRVEPLPRPVGEVRSFCRDSEGSLWAATSAGLWRRKDAVWTHYGTAEGLASATLHQVRPDPAGGVWIATDGGLDHFFHGAITHHRVHPDSSRPEHLTAVLVDDEGGLWVSEWSQGLAHLRPSRFLTYTTRDGLPGDYVSSVLQDASGDVWIGTNFGLAVFREGRIETPAIAPATPLNVVSLTLDGGGALLVGTTHGVYRARRSASGLTLEDVAIGPGLYARVVRRDRGGVLWIGTDDNGLVRLDGGSQTRFTVDDGLPSPHVRALAEDGQGVLWVGTKGGGLAHFDGRRFIPYEELAGSSVHGLQVDATGALWIATRHGLCRLKNGVLRRLTHDEGLHATFIYAFVDDRAGDVWMSCSKGIFRVPRRELDEVADGTRPSVSSMVYGVEHGLGGVVGTVGHHPGAICTREGTVWFATADGVAVADPQRLPPSPPPVARVEEIEADHRNVSVAQAAALPPGRGDLVIRYTSLSFTAPEKLRFRYRLSGFDAGWIDADTRRVAYYTNVPPGRYRFEVTARGSDGPWNEAPASFDVVLTPHLYQRRWFFAVPLAAAMAVGLGGHLFRVRRLAAQRARLERVVDERTAALQEATRALDASNRDLERRVADGIEKLRGSERMAAYGQMVAAVAHEVRHPIFALQAAAHVVRERLGPELDVAPQLRTLATETERLNVLMGDLLDFARPGELQRASVAAAALLAEARDVFASEGHPGIAVVVDIEPGLPALFVDRVRLTQVLLNLMRNAATHAAGVSTITLRAQPFGGGVRLDVADDGGGIQADVRERMFEPFVTTGRGTGLGLSIVQRVVAAHGGVVTVESAAGRGTVFHVDLAASN
jgi:ligand-binding sensor domain-containing protein/signal transduction histidine kinase